MIKSVLFYVPLFVIGLLLGLLIPTQKEQPRAPAFQRGDGIAVVSGKYKGWAGTVVTSVTAPDGSPQYSVDLMNAVVLDDNRTVRIMRRFAIASESELIKYSERE